MSGLTLTPGPDEAGPDGAGAGSRNPADRLGTRVGLHGVLGDLRRQARRSWRRRGTTGFGWDLTDNLTRAWWPQGITTSQDSGAPQPAGAPLVLLAAWYRREGTTTDAAVRVSVVDLGTAEARPDRPAYEHVLLVESSRGPASGPAGHRQVRVHAGGLVWWGNLLLVADTRAGLQIFDLRDIVRVPADLPGTHGCRYLLPRRARWRAGHADGVKPLRWSFCALDRTDPDGLWLVAGEYSHSGRGARLARFPLAGAEPSALESAEVFVTDIPSMQGACRVRGTYVVSASFGRFRRGHLWVGNPGGFRKHAGVLPAGPEDLSHDQQSGRLWTQTEYPGRRGVVSVPLAEGSVSGSPNR